MSAHFPWDEFMRLGLHVIELDPYFRNAVLYTAGCLAFNLERPYEALGTLNYALKNTPKDWKFLKLVAAIGYSKHYGRAGGDPVRLRCATVGWRERDRLR